MEYISSNLKELAIFFSIVAILSLPIKLICCANKVLEKDILVLVFISIIFFTVLLILLDFYSNGSKLLNVASWEIRDFRITESSKRQLGNIPALVIYNRYGGLPCWSVSIGLEINKLKCLENEQRIPA